MEVTTEKIMKVCYFGSYDSEYARNRIVMRGLKRSGIEVVEKKLESGWFSLSLSLWKEKDKYDAVIVGYARERIPVLFARLVFAGPVIWDAFLSLYDSWVYDRRLVSPHHPKAWYYWFLDWVAGALADYILMDTNEHIRYFSSEFGVSKKKFLRVFIGVDDSVFRPIEGENQVKKEFFQKNPKLKAKTVVGFHGKYIPLQGVEYIIRAAKILENDTNIHFMLIGSGQTYEAARELEQKLDPGNITFIDRVPFEEMPYWIDIFDVALGIFGNTKKTQRVIPNKVYESLAMRKPVVTADTPAICELFTPGGDIEVCKHADPNSLAAAVKELAENTEMQRQLAEKGFKTIRDRARPRDVVRPLIDTLKS